MLTRAEQSGPLDADAVGSKVGLDEHFVLQGDGFSALAEGHLLHL